MLRFEVLPFGLTVLFFLAASVVVWLAGTRLSGYADEVSDRSGLGQAFVGALLLGGVTSLPEVATTVSASAIGNAPLAVNNIFGGIALQVVVLAIADWIARGRALSSRVDDDGVLLQATLLIIVLAVAVLGVLVPDELTLGVGRWAYGVLGFSILSFFLIHQHREGLGWRPSVRAGDEAARRGGLPESRREGKATSRLAVRLVVASLVVLAAGYVLAQTADRIAEQTGLGSSFVGAVVLALATSLPELSTTLGAVRLGAYALAYGNIFGANILDAGILFLADAVYSGAPVLNEVGLFAAAAGLLAIGLTAVLLVGLLRRRKTVAVGLGFDSAAVLVLYAAGLAVLFGLR